MFLTVFMMRRRCRLSAFDNTGLRIGLFFLIPPHYQLKLSCQSRPPWKFAHVRGIIVMQLPAALDASLGERFEIDSIID